MLECYEITGLMSGSSLDGLDLAHCRFSRNPSGKWEGEILEAKAFPFPEDLENDLRSIRQTSAIGLSEAELKFLRFAAGSVRSFHSGIRKKPIALASHGHTVFHKPAEGYTLQIGNGGILSGMCGLPVVSDFRTLDVGLGGQGAPLVPGAERFLFSDYDACLNLGGICNVSFPKSRPFMGFDVSPCNQLLNLAAGWLGLDFDPEGKTAASGKPIPELLERLSAHRFYQMPAPKSLGNEDVAQHWFPDVERFRDQPEHVLHTLCLHIAAEIGRALKAHSGKGKLLITGGGAFHSFLINAIRKETAPDWEVVVPEARVISFKEAYCFAFLGLLRILGENNTFREVTGASLDSCGGTVYGKIQLS